MSHYEGYGISPLLLLGGGAAAYKLFFPDSCLSKTAVHSWDVLVQQFNSADGYLASLINRQKVPTEPHLTYLNSIKIRIAQYENTYVKSQREAITPAGLIISAGYSPDACKVINEAKVVGELIKEFIEALEATSGESAPSTAKSKPGAKSDSGMMTYILWGAIILGGAYVAGRVLPTVMAPKYAK